MLISILYKDAALSFYFAALSACFAGILSGNSLSLTLIFFITGMVTAISTRRLRRRIQILSAGLFAGAAQALLFWMAYPQAGLNDIAPNLFNGLICAVGVTGILPLLENFFAMVTDISLLELSDFNHPLLKKMILDAPGTYHHSIVVGNIAEAAAESIQANSLLARIGGYYHDIGKLNNPEYFMENQKALSKHENLSPSISKMVIINHIKEGMELARKYRLKPVIMDFITQHHGSGLVYYFYRKALEGIEQDEKILEEGFRYPGPKPASRETAIVLLADSVEAATRAIAEPNASRIEEVVHKVINNKFIDGQLDNCDLTLKDLEKIAKVFIHMLSGIYHGRINYPESSGHAREHHHKNTTKRRLPLTYGVLKRCARNTLRLLGNKRDGLFLGISFFNDSRIKKLNQKYLKTNTPTDVIAFSYSKDNADIAISLDTAKRNAGIFKNSLKKEILLYIIHGILHLSGYDDTTCKEKSGCLKNKRKYSIKYGYH